MFFVTAGASVPPNMPLRAPDSKETRALLRIRVPVGPELSADTSHGVSNSAGSANTTNSSIVLRAKRQVLTMRGHGPQCIDEKRARNGMMRLGHAIQVRYRQGGH